MLLGRPRRRKVFPVLGGEEDEASLSDEEATRMQQEQLQPGRASLVVESASEDGDSDGPVVMGHHARQLRSARRRSLAGKAQPRRKAGGRHEDRRQPGWDNSDSVSGGSSAGSATLRRGRRNGGGLARDADDDEEEDIDDEQSHEGKRANKSRYKRKQRRSNQTGSGSGSEGGDFVEAEEKDPRYTIGELSEAGLAGFAGSGAGGAVSQLGASKSSVLSPGGGQARHGLVRVGGVGGDSLVVGGGSGALSEAGEGGEVVEFAAVDDGAEQIVGAFGGSGVAGGSGGPGAQLNPELERHVEKLAELYEHSKKKNRELRKKLRSAEQQSEAVRKKARKLEEDMEEAELKAELNLRMLQYKSKGGEAGPRTMAGDLEAQRKRDEQRRQMYSADGGAEENETEGIATVGVDSASSKWVKRLGALSRKHFPLNRDLRRIEAHFGSSVAAYFSFLRWMFINYLVMGALCGMFLLKHVYSLQTFSALSAAERKAQYNSRGEPWAYYDWRAASWGEKVGFLPRFTMFSSFNPGDSGTMYYSGTLYAGTAIRDARGAAVAPVADDTLVQGAAAGERLDYVTIIAVCHLVLLASAGYKWIREDRRSKVFAMFEQLENKSRFAQLALNAWDHSLKDRAEIEDLKHALLDTYFVSVKELEAEDLRKQRSLEQRVVLFLRRSLSNLLYLAVQGGSATAIILLTAESGTLGAKIQLAIANNELLRPLFSIVAGSLVPIAVSFINGCLPTIVAYITALEKWDDAGFYTKLMLFRLYVAKIFNAVIQVFSFLQLLDPFLLRGTPASYILGEDLDRSTRRNTEKRFEIAAALFLTGTPSGAQLCRADMYGLGVFQLVVTEFVISKSIFLGWPMTRWFVTAKLLKRPFVRPEFLVARQMVSALYFQQLCFLSLPFYPFGTIAIALLMLLAFKIESRTLEAFMQKPKKAWSAKDAANFFIKFFVFSLCVSLTVTFLMLSDRNLPKACPLQEHVMRAKLPAAAQNPLAVCYDGDLSSSSDAKLCPLAGRSALEVLAKTRQSEGLEELRFWEDWLVATNRTAPDAAAVNAVAALRNASLMSYASETAVSDSSLLVNETAVSDTSLLVCSLACGPFVYNTNIYQPFDQFLERNLSTLYVLLTGNPFVIWAIVLLVMLRLFFVTNTLSVTQDLWQEKELALRTVVVGLESKLKKATVKMDKMKMIDSPAASPMLLLSPIASPSPLASPTAPTLAAQIGKK
jgi:hypothetical protein